MRCGYFNCAPSGRVQAGLIVAWFFALFLSSFAQAETIAVIYPEMREPYSQVFASITTGIRSNPGIAIKEFVVQTNTDTNEITLWLAKHKITGVIALSNRAYNLLDPASPLPTVIGAAIFSPSTAPYPGITLNPTPDKVFRALTQFRPSVKTVHVVYEKGQSTWVIENAVSLGAAMGLQIRVHWVDGLQEAATTYRDLQQQLDEKTDAIWLPIGGPSREKSILQSILETAWQKEQVIVSSNLSDVRRGALLALFPDNEGLGRALVALLAQQRAEQRPADATGVTKPSKVLFLENLQEAINVRTAEHLGKRYSTSDLAQFEFIYPPQ